MKQQRYNLDDLLQLLKKIYIILPMLNLPSLSLSGKLSVFEKDKIEDDITFPLMIDGKVQSGPFKALETNRALGKTTFKTEDTQTSIKFRFVVFKMDNFILT